MVVAFLDFEAAGLKSFPVEVAWCARPSRFVWPVASP